MLKNIPPILIPELLKVMSEMGHGDQIVIGDGNFPAESIGRGKPVIRLDSCGVPELLDAMLQFFPLDPYVEQPVTLMEVVPGDPVETPIWGEYQATVAKYDNRGSDAVGHLERFAFYEQAKKAYAVIATGEKALYANIILQKGVI
ncbi:MAG TPA: fucose isomerase [Candidatus Onthovicinus excrementipullorum]|nr:fucose isomerase [Candidatus Onthovicinus excrementipullorum]